RWMETMRNAASAAGSSPTAAPRALARPATWSPSPQPGASPKRGVTEDDMTTEIEVRSEQLPPGVYRRPASRYLWIQYHDRGQMVRESAKTTNPKKAAKLRGRRLGELATDEFIGPQQRRVTVAQVLDGYRDNRRLAGTPGLGNI